VTHTDCHNTSLTANTSAEHTDISVGRKTASSLRQLNQPVIQLLRGSAGPNLAPSTRGIHQHSHDADTITVALAQQVLQTSPESAPCSLVPVTSRPWQLCVFRPSSTHQSSVTYTHKTASLVYIRYSTPKDSGATAGANARTGGSHRPSASIFNGRELGSFSSILVFPPSENVWCRLSRSGCPSCHPTNHVKALKETPNKH